MNHSNIPSDYYLAARDLVKMPGLNYSEMKLAAQDGGILERWVSKKTRRVYYRSKNFCLDLKMSNKTC